jgi:hypothetical protein
MIFSNLAKISVTAYAREEETKKGMDASQITGAASSYARKYALNGLFAIDDTKDADHTNTGQDEPKKATPTPTMPQPPKVDPGAVQTVTDAQIKRLFAIANKSDKDKSEIKAWLSVRGMGSSKELTPELYEELVVWVETPKPDLTMAAPCPDGSENYPLSYCGDACPRDIECDRKV